MLATCLLTKNWYQLSGIGRETGAEKRHKKGKNISHIQASYFCVLYVAAVLSDQPLSLKQEKIEMGLNCTGRYVCTMPRYFATASWLASPSA